jgi:hypothetical protein
MSKVVGIGIVEALKRLFQKSKGRLWRFRS